MELLNELNKSVKTVLEVSNKIDEEINTEIWDKAPSIIHQRFTRELVSIARKYEKQKMNEIPEFMDMLKTIEILEKLYPKLSKI